MRSVHVGNTIIGEGRPKICVPVVARNIEEAKGQIKEIKNVPVDIVEFRGDYLDNHLEIDYINEIIGIIKSEIQVPVIYTFRTANEGGEKDIDTSEYFTLLGKAVSKKAADIVDLEIFRGIVIKSENETENQNQEIIISKDLTRFLESARGNGVKVIMSNHDFHRTPCTEEIVGRLKLMQSMGADIAKIAVMPQSKRDVLDLLAATLTASENMDIPVVTMSMSKDGVISRLAGEVFGSSITFGTAGVASAPGQINAVELSAVLDIFHS